MLTMVAAMYADIKPRFDKDTPIAVRQSKMKRYAFMSAHQPKQGGIGSQAVAPMKSIGHPLIPVVLVQFQDVKFTTACSYAINNPDSVRRYFHLHFNGDGSGNLYRGSGNWGSVSEYFRDQSNGQFVPEYVVMGPITLNEPYSYYGKNESITDLNINIFYRELTQKAQDWATQRGINWMDFDNDGDGVVDMLESIYAGYGENACDDPNTIWPKNSYGTVTVNGIKYQSYLCTNELYSPKNPKCEGIGVICHEFGHSLGLPDFYDTNYIAYGMDYWDVMDSGCYCYGGYRPCSLSAYEREFLGWDKLVTLEAGVDQTVTVYPLTDELYRGKGYKIVNPADNNEYYVIENRQSSPAGWDTNIGRGSKTLGYLSGLLITHIHYVESRWLANNVNTVPSHQLITVMPADGTLDSFMYYDGTDADELRLFNSAGGDLYPGFKDVHEFKGEQQTIYGAAKYMNQPVTDIIQNEDGTITFRFCSPEALAIRDLNDYTANGGKSVFDMLGRRVNADKNQLSEGIYIINGKKVLVK